MSYTCGISLIFFLMFMLPDAIIKKEVKLYMKKTVKTAAVLLGASAVGAGLGYGVCTLFDELLFNRNLILPPELARKISDCDATHLGEYLENNLRWLESYGYEKHILVSSRGEKLVGYLMKAKEESDTYVFCAHGYRSYGKKEFCGVAQYYLEKNINVFFVDHVASGESEGTHCTFGYHETEDCLKWLSYMREKFGDNIKIILHGVSMGASTVMMMSSETDLPENVKGVVADCGYSRAVDLFSHKLRALKVPPEKLILAVNFVNRHNLGFDFRSLSPVDSVKNTKVPILFIHGNCDGLVPCNMAQELFSVCGHTKKDILIVDGADHAQSYMIGKELYTDKMDSFLSGLI